MYIIDNKIKSAALESYKTLRTNIQYSSLDKEIKTIVITSSELNEGKTMTSINLSLTFAAAEKKVLLIDCDLRMPSIHRQFKISNLKGLSDVLISKDNLEDSIYSYNKNLKILPAGNIPPNPSEMLSSNTMQKLIEEIKADYDIIILDSPPLIAVTDAQILSAKADGTILVVKADSTKKEAVIESKELLKKVNANILGVVLNKVKSSVKKYSGYYGKDNKKKRNKKIFWKRCKGDAKK